MPQTIYLPRTTNPWEQYLPQFLSSMILQDQSQRFRQRMMEKEEEQAKELGRIKLATTEGVSEVPTEPYAAPSGGNVFTAYGKQYSYSPKQKVENVHLTEQGLIYFKDGKPFVDTSVTTIPGITTEQTTNAKGDVTITGIEKQSGNIKWQKTLKGVGKPSPEKEEKYEWLEGPDGVAFKHPKDQPPPPGAKPFHRPQTIIMPSEKEVDKLYNVPGAILDKGEERLKDKIKADETIKMEIFKDSRKQGTPEHQNVYGKYRMQLVEPEIKAKHPNAVFGAKPKKNPNEPTVWVWVLPDGKVIADSNRGYIIGR